MINLTSRQLGIVGAGSVTITQSGLNYVVSGSASVSTGSAALNGRALVHTISLSNHGFPVESVVTIDSSGNYVKAIADNAAKTNALGVVSASGATSFSFVSAGYIDSLVGKLPNTTYYLSPTTSGLITEIPPTATGSFILPLFVTDSATGGYVNIGMPIEIVADDYITTGFGFSSYYPRSNPSGYISTGSADSRYYGLNNASGFLNTLSGLSIGLVQNMSGDLSSRLGATGSTLFNLISASSAGVGSLNGQSGALSLTGAGSVSVLVNGQTITVSGSATNADFSGYITTGNADLRYYPLGSNPSGFLTTLSGLSTGYVQNISGVLADKIGATGQTLLALINASSAGVGSLNGLSGALLLTGAGNTTVTSSGQIFTISGANYVNWIPLAVSDELSPLLTGVARLTFRMANSFTLSAVRASVTIPPTGSTLIVDINENGTSILSTKLSIDASEKTSTTAASAAVISDAALADDSEITVDIDQIGSTYAGAGLKVYLIGTNG